MDLTSITSINTVLDSSKNSATSQAADRLTSAAEKLSSNSSEEELKGVLKDFESYFVEQVLKQTKKAFIHESENSDATMSRYKELYTDKIIEQLADKIVDDIGENYTQQLYEQMRRNYGMDQMVSPAESSD